MEETRARIRPYIQQQFEKYNELWSTLCRLKKRMHTLWGAATEDNWISFAKDLEKAFDALDDCALLIEDDHHQALHEVLYQFTQFKTGKNVLYDLRNSGSTGDPTLPNKIALVINQNRQTKDQLLQLISEIRCQLREQLVIGMTHGEQGDSADEDL